MAEKTKTYSTTEPQYNHSEQQHGIVRHLTERAIVNTSLAYYGLRAAISDIKADRQTVKAARAKRKAENKTPSLSDRTRSFYHTRHAQFSEKQASRSENKAEKLESSSILLEEIGKKALKLYDKNLLDLAETPSERRAAKKILKTVKKIKRRQNDEWRSHLYGSTGSNKLRLHEQAEKILGYHTQVYEDKAVEHRKKHENHNQNTKFRRHILENLPEEIEQKHKKQQKKAEDKSMFYRNQAQKYREAAIHIHRPI